LNISLNSKKKRKLSTVFTSRLFSRSTRQNRTKLEGVYLNSVIGCPYKNDF